MPRDRQSVAASTFPEIRFGGFSRVDGLVAFYTRVHALLQPEHTALDIGCGRGTQSDDLSPRRGRMRSMRGACRHTIGIDVDPIGKDNPFIEEFRLIEPPYERWPIEDASIDLAMSDCVLEHIEKPDAFFAELARVLKPGGHICMRTPNSLGYIAIASRLVPNSMHQRILKRLQPHRPTDDVFPTYYRANRKGRINKLLATHGFEGVIYRHEGQPGYLTFSKLAFRMGSWAGRLMPDVFKSTLLIFAQRQE